MSKVICNKQDIINIADNIRSVTQTSGTMTLNEMARELNATDTTRIFNVNFPQSATGATIYYTGAGCKLKTATIDGGATIRVINGTIIYANMDIFDGHSFVFPDNQTSYTKISNRAFVAHMSFKFTYDDGAPV